MELVERWTEVIHVKHFGKVVTRTIMSYFPRVRSTVICFLLKIIFMCHNKPCSIQLIKFIHKCILLITPLVQFLLNFSLWIWMLVCNIQNPRSPHNIFCIKKFKMLVWCAHTYVLVFPLNSIAKLIKFQWNIRWKFKERQVLRGSENFIFFLT